MHSTVVTPSTYPDVGNEYKLRAKMLCGNLARISIDDRIRILELGAEFGAPGWLDATEEARSSREEVGASLLELVECMIRSRLRGMYVCCVERIASIRWLHLCRYLVY